MSYKALYRKYRSQTFNEVIGQDSIVKTLQNSLEKGKISHAYLFSGPRGTGKTSIARLFAKALNCREGVGKICNHCDNCIATSQNQNPDVIEIDAASNSGVDEVRNLIEKVRYVPVNGKYKVYIIDEVHMMTTSAFNALLKTLEEPPSFVVFILCTTEPNKLLPTIVSRCQRYEFKKLSFDDLHLLITKTLKKENITYTEESVSLIIELANGGARDALSILDQIIAYAGSSITVDDIEKIFGLTSIKEKNDLLLEAYNANSINILNKFTNFVSRNVDFTRLVNELLDILKDTLIYKRVKSLNLISQNHYEIVKNLSQYFTDSILLQYIDTLMECLKELKISNNPTFVIEIYLLKLCSINSSSKATSEVKEEIKPEIKVEVDTIKPQVAQENKSEIKIEKPQVVQENKSQVEPQKTKILDKKPAELKPKSNSLKYIGEANFIDNDSLLNILVKANKTLKDEINKKRENLSSFITEKEFKDAAVILLDSRPFAITDDYILLVNDFELDIKRINLQKNQEIFAELIKKVSGKHFFVYGVTISRSVDLKTKYLNLYQVHKLPNKNDELEINIQTIVEE